MFYLLLTSIILHSSVPQCRGKGATNQKVSKDDPSSYSNPEDFLAKHLDLKWNVDFDTKTISGLASYQFQIVNTGASYLILDTRDIEVIKIVSEGIELAHSLGKRNSVFGTPLQIDVKNISQKEDDKMLMMIEIEYKTSRNCSALAWMEPHKTAGKKYPFLFSQNEPIHGRSLYPCQDTPSVKTTFSSEITVPKTLVALTSAVPSLEEPEEKGDQRIFKFSQKIPIPSYLMSIAVGDLKSKKVGPRSTIYAEPEIVDSATKEFSDIEKMMEVAEHLFGKYEWEVYNLLILPKPYPVNGMEHPCLSFFSQQLITGDKGMISTLAHELAHSWFGNLVTNRNWQHFWINEGFTVFAERKILGVLEGEEYRQFLNIFGWSRLTNGIDKLKDEPDITKLVVEKVVNPDRLLNAVPYEKGNAFLYHLEQTVGGPQVFEYFLREYIQKYRHQSIHSQQFTDEVISHFAAEKLKDIDWNSWFHSPGMPPVSINYSQTLMEPCTKLAQRWREWNSTVEKSNASFQKEDVEELRPVQLRQFLQELLDHQHRNISLEAVKKMEEIYGMHERKNNADIRLRWCQLCGRVQWIDALPFIFEYLNEEGRFHPLGKVYRELYKWEEVRDKANQNFQQNKKYMMAVAVKSVSKILQLDTK